MGKALKDTKTHSLQEASLQIEPKIEKEVATTCAVPVKASFQSTPLH